MEKTITIEKAGPNHVPIILGLALKTFVETYGEHNDPQNMEIYMRESFSEEVIARELGDQHARFFIAYLDGVPVGFTKLRDDRLAKTLEAVRTLEIQRIYILKEYQGYNAGKALMEKIKEVAKDEHYQTVWLQVWQQNYKAIRFYQRAGFVVYETTPFKLGNEIHQDFLMRYDLYL
jgi:ribosomal protein S18 acetylase RimI-like enzyme